MSVVKVGPDDFEELAEVWEASVRATHDFLRGGYSGIAFSVACPLPAGGRTSLPAGCGAYRGVHRSERKSYRHVVRSARIPGQRLRTQVGGVGRRPPGADSVDVNEQNPQAVGFYLRMGFAVVGRSETDDADRPFPILHLRLEK